MSESYYLKREREAQARLEQELAKPFEAEARIDGVIHGEDAFDPWSLFPALYGSYSNDFDECAIDVLTEIKSGTKKRQDLGAEMFREMLCTGGFCDYGTSPRVCFWQLDGALLPRLIDRWAEWSKWQWTERES